VLEPARLLGYQAQVAPSHRIASLGGAGVAAATAAHLLPSTLVLAQWWPARLPDPGRFPGVATWRAVPASGGRGNGVALTFDDGPDPGNTPAVLDELDRLGFQATFFCLGQQVVAHPGLVKEVVDRGHELGLHGYDHCRHLLRGPAAITEDLRRAVGALGEAGQPGARFFRPPYGQVSGGSVVAAARLGLELVLWSAWGREWADPEPASIAGRVRRRLAPGAIVLLHDSDVSAPAGMAARAAAALPAIADGLREKDLQPVCLGELLR
jgi:peptidoglycan/xylan/chitin deacetylase (PgdA/CDA1 family)